MYDDDDLLMLSGIQHFAFCERQWALIHIEQQWADNRLTVEGSWMHRRVDNPFETERQGSKVQLRSVSIKSYALGLYGIADMLELHPADDDTGVPIPRYNGKWHILPIEYKHGKPKREPIDEVQLCAQAMCIEEMYDITLTTGCFYYGQTKRREYIEFTQELRQHVIELAQQMHQIYANGITPVAKYRNQCKSCSLIDQCFVSEFNKAASVHHYLKQIANEKAT